MLDGVPLRDIIKNLRKNITCVSAYTHIVQLISADTNYCNKCSEISNRGGGGGNTGGGGPGLVKGDGTVDHSKVKFPASLKNKLIVWYSFDEKVLPLEPCILSTLPRDTHTHTHTHTQCILRTATTPFTTRIQAVNTGVTPLRRAQLASQMASSGERVSSVANRAAASLYTTVKHFKWFVRTAEAPHLPCLKLYILMRRLPRTSACHFG